jgi:hypothetical protein
MERGVVWGSGFGMVVKIKMMMMMMIGKEDDQVLALLSRRKLCVQDDWVRICWLGFGESEIISVSRLLRPINLRDCSSSV